MTVVDQATFSAIMAAREAAYWAAWSGVAAWVIGLASLAVTGGGLVFVWRQLVVAELNAKAAIDAAHASLLAGRPWLSIRVIEQGEGLMSPDGAMALNLRITVENVGNAPALDVSLIAFSIAQNAWDTDAETALRSHFVPGFLRGSVLHGAEIQTRTAVNWPTVGGDDHLLVVVCSYAIPGLSGPRFTAKPYKVEVAKQAIAVRNETEVYRTQIDPVTHLRLLMT